MNQEAVLQVHQSIPKSIGHRIDLYSGFKRVFDVIISMIGLVFLLPIALFVKLALIVTKDNGKLFFKQERIGKDGKLFTIYKFRTMVNDADNILYSLMQSDEDFKKEYTLTKKLKDDPRITKLGKFLRKTSIDELPQLINIFKGDMSLIGNRPYLPREKDDMTIYYNDIVKTKPGLTGYWQVSGRSNLDFEDRLKLESYYSKHNSFKMDVKIFFKTFATVLKGNGAE